MRVEFKPRVGNGICRHVHDFRRLHVWCESVEIANSIDQLTAEFPGEERFGMSAQMRSAAVSVSSNIAEGAGRGSSREFARFLRIALGSVSELDSQLAVAVRVGLCQPQGALSEEINRLRQQLKTLHDGLRRSDSLPGT